jgi:hypothetical protein
MIYLIIIITILNIILKTYIIVNANKSWSKVKLAVQIYSVIMRFMSHSLFLPIISK